MIKKPICKACGIELKAMIVGPMLVDRMETPEEMERRRCRMCEGGLTHLAILVAAKADARSRFYRTTRL